MQYGFHGSRFSRRNTKPFSLHELTGYCAGSCHRHPVEALHSWGYLARPAFETVTRQLRSHFEVVPKSVKTDLLLEQIVQVDGQSDDALLNLAGPPFEESQILIDLVEACAWE